MLWWGAKNNTNRRCDSGWSNRSLPGLWSSRWRRLIARRAVEVPLATRMTPHRRWSEGLKSESLLWPVGAGPAAKVTGMAISFVRL